MGSYELAEHVHACRVENHYILLDLQRDKYIGINPDQFDSVITSNQEQANELAAELLSAGLISEKKSPADSKPSRGDITVGTQDLQNADDTFEESTLYRLPRFLFASWRAHRYLMTQSLYWTVNRVLTRKLEGLQGCNLASCPRTAELVRAFNILRPFFPRPYLCLFDSLALIEFLATYEIYPDWIFGVREDPFTAHCWIQQETFVLNDEVEHTSLYTPIMRV